MRLTRWTGCSAALALAVTWAALHAGPAQTAPKSKTYPYQCIALGTLGGEFSHARGVNDFAEVIGISNTDPSVNMSFNRDERAFYWKDRNGNNASDAGEMVFLGSFGYNSGALSINNLGEAVGWSKYSNSNPVDQRAVLWNVRADPPTMTDLNDLLSAEDRAGWTLQNARAINGNRQVVGTGIPTTDPAVALTVWQRAFLLDLSVSPPTLTDLGVLKPETSHSANALNNLSSPQILGSGGAPWLYSGGLLFDLSPLTAAVGINDSAAVAGQIPTNNGYRHPAYWVDANGNGAVDPLEAVDLGVFGSLETSYAEASALTNPGLVVGNTAAPRAYQGYVVQHAFRWQSGTSPSSKEDLNSLTSAPFPLRAAKDISENGNIVGWGSKGTVFFPSSIDKAYLLKPTQ